MRRVSAVKPAEVYTTFGRVIPTLFEVAGYPCFNIFQWPHEAHCYSLLLVMYRVPFFFFIFLGQYQDSSVYISVNSVHIQDQLLTQESHHVMTVFVW